LLVLALIDVWWQRYRFERDLRMTKEEVKDELRSMEGDPLVKRRQRQIQLQLANQRLRKEVPKADVIVTNPTHYAVAIAYEMGKMPAPRVVAKGVDEMALRIREIATEFAIPMVERRALARALYDTVDVGKFIPEAFYHAIAEILAYVYELTGRTPLEHRRGAVSRSRR
jgi:flagellar biosynthetic protein FlhB